MNLLSSQYSMDVGFIELTIGTNILVECFQNFFSPKYTNIKVIALNFKTKIVHGLKGALELVYISPCSATDIHKDLLYQH